MFYVHCELEQVLQQVEEVEQGAPFAPAGPLEQHFLTLLVFLPHVPEHSVETLEDPVAVIQDSPSTPAFPRAQHFNVAVLSTLHVPEQHSVEPLAFSVVQFFFINSFFSFATEILDIITVLITCPRTTFSGATCSLCCTGICICSFFSKGTAFQG